MSLNRMSMLTFTKKDESRYSALNAANDCASVIRRLKERAKDINENEVNTDEKNI